LPDHNAENQLPNAAYRPFFVPFASLSILISFSISTTTPGYSWCGCTDRKKMFVEFCKKIMVSLTNTELTIAMSR